MEKLLRNDAEVALDEAVEGCKAAADHYRSAAEVAPSDLTDLFEELGRQRLEWWRRLEDEVRRMGNLPSAPDADREAVEQLVTRVKAALSRDEHLALIERAAKVEEDIAAKAASALREDLPPSARELLGEIKAGSNAARQRFADL
jgi:hypothetical protein